MRMNEEEIDVERAAFSVTDRPPTDGDHHRRAKRCSEAYGLVRNPKALLAVLAICVACGFLVVALLAGDNRSSSSASNNGGGVMAPPFENEFGPYYSPQDESDFDHEQIDNVYVNEADPPTVVHDNPEEVEPEFEENGHDLWDNKLWSELSAEHQALVYLLHRRWLPQRLELPRGSTRVTS